MCLTCSGFEFDLFLLRPVAHAGGDRAVCIRSVFSLPGSARLSQLQLRQRRAISLLFVELCMTTFHKD